MEYVSYLFYYAVLSIVFKFKEKLMVLLYLELSFLLVLTSFVLTNGSSSFSSFMLIVLTLVMVVDSVLGISLLISSARNSTKISASLNSI